MQLRAWSKTDQTTIGLTAWQPRLKPLGLVSGELGALSPRARGSIIPLVRLYSTLDWCCLDYPHAARMPPAVASGLHRVTLQATRQHRGLLTLSGHSGYGVKEPKSLWLEWLQ